METCLETGVLTKEKLLAQLPRTQEGTLKCGDEANDIWRLLNHYPYSQKDLLFFKAWIDQLCLRCGHSGFYIPKKLREGGS